MRSIAISPDGKWAATGGRSLQSNEAKIWDLQTGACIQALPHSDSISAVAISPQGETLLTSAIFEKSIRVWDTSTWTQKASLQVHQWGALSLVPLEDGDLVFSSGASVEDPVLRLFEIGTGECIRSFYGHTSVVLSASVSLTNDRGLSGSSDRTVRLWDLNTAECLAILQGHSGRVFSVKITRDGSVGISASEDTTIKVWDLNSMRCLGTLEGHQGEVRSVAISPDETVIASAGYKDHTVRLWKRSSGACLQVIEQKEDGFKPLALAFTPSGSHLLVSTSAGKINVYRLTAIHSPEPVEAVRHYVNAKVVLIGEGTVGKTSLAHRLVEDEYVVRDRTHGMNVWQLDLPLPPDATIEREALLWDLAGQEDYRLIHQLFLDETALALLLINPQKDDPFAEAGDWLKALKAACGQRETARDVAQLLIFSQTDVGGMKLGNSKIERFCEQYGFNEWLPTSAKSGENCSDKKNGNQASKLKQLIASSIPWDNLPWTSTPRLLNELKKAVVAMRDDRDIRLLRFAELIATSCRGPAGREVR